MAFRVGSFQRDLTHCQCPPRMESDDPGAARSLLGDCEFPTARVNRQEISAFAPQGNANGVPVTDPAGNIEARSSEALAEGECERLADDAGELGQGIVARSPLLKHCDPA